MTPLFGFVGMFLGWIMSLLSIFLILLVLVQRGRGGGLTGALGGPGGQSAFGSKAGDMFTKITSVAALLWIGLCALATASLGQKPIKVADPSDNIPGMQSTDPADTSDISFPSPTDPNVTPESTSDADMEALGGAGIGAADGSDDAAPVGDADTEPAGEDAAAPAGEDAAAAADGADAAASTPSEGTDPPADE